MPKPPPRRFTLLDAMIVVGASAFAMYACRQLFFDDTDEIDTLSSGSEFFPWPYWLTVGHRVVGMLLMVSSITLLILRLVGPRPPLRRIMRQPGAVACLFAVSYSVMSLVARNAAEWSVRLFMKKPSISVLGWEVRLADPASPWSYLLPSDHVVPCIVATAWLALWLGRAGRPERGWIDRSGRAVGWLWIATGVVGAFH